MVAVSEGGVRWVVLLLRTKRRKVHNADEVLVEVALRYGGKWFLWGWYWGMYVEEENVVWEIPQWRSLVMGLPCLRAVMW